MATSFRNTKLLSHSYIRTLLSTTLTALAPLIATLVDGLFASNMLGTEAFNAVNVMLPVVNAVGVLTMICNMGGSVLAAGELAKGNIDKARRIFTIALVSAVTVAVITVAVMFCCQEGIANALAPSPACAGYVKEYLQLMLIYFLLVPFCTTLNNFVSVEGNPSLTTTAVMSANIVNVLLDVLFMGAFHWGIRGAALATVISGIVNVGVFLPFLLRGRSKYRLVKVTDDKWKILWNNLKQGFGFNVFYIVTNAFMILCNGLISSTVGPEGLTLFGVCLQIQSLTFAVTVGIVIAGISQISFLKGEGDTKGVLHILDSSLRDCVIFYGALALLMVFVPSAYLWVFGLADPSWQAIAPVPFMCYAIYYFCFCLIAVYSTLVFQLSGRVGAKVFFVFGIATVSYCCMLLFSRMGGDRMWYGLIVGSIPVLLAAFGYGNWLHRRDRQLTTFTAVNKYPDCVKLECSLDYEQKSRAKVEEAIRTYATVCEMPDEVYQAINTSIHKLCHIIVRRRTNVQYFDLTLQEHDDYYKLIIKDGGNPFNPATATDPQNAQQITYRYVFGLNVTSMLWPKDKKEE